MGNTSPDFHRLACALAGASTIVRDLPQYDIPDEKSDLLLRSYSFLCHAAIEEYLESLSLFILKEAFSLYKRDGQLRLPIISAISYYNSSDKLSLHTTPSGATLAKAVLESLFEEARSKHYKAVTGNNGIKTKDQDNLLIPTGCRIFEIDHILSQTLNSLGEDRGKVAHKYTMSMKLPRHAWEIKISTIQNLIQDFDNIACSRINILFH
ncbi:hypothetical protein JYP51_18510 [Ponticoccus gilvus]|nr:hypothetical protein [Enemella evansiae]